MKFINKNILKFFALCGTASLVLTSCTKGFEEINDPKEAANAEILSCDGYNISSFLVQLQDQAFPEQENAYQMTNDLIGNYLGRYMTYSVSGWNGKNFACFNAPEGWVRWPFRQVTPKISSAFAEIEHISEGKDINHYWALIIRAKALLALTDMYGPFPIGLDKEHSSYYSSQEDVYKALLKDLNSSIDFLKAILVTNPSAKFNTSADLIYNGNIGQWIKFANSLKLRMAVRMRYVAPELAKQTAEEAVADGVITDNADNALRAYIPRGLYKTSVEWGDSRVCADIDVYMNGYQDPRLSKYFNSAKEVTKRPFIGCLAGANIGNKDEAVKLYSNANAPENSKGIWFVAAETYFARAEGALAGWTMGGTAQELYEAGVKASFEQWGAEGANDYLSNADRKPAAYEDADGGYGSSLPAPSEITIKWDDSASDEVKLERIITQKWIALFPNGLEAWAELRRTGYPKVFDIQTSKNGSSLKVPNRIPFDTEEKTNNPEAYQLAVKLLNGADSYDTEMWWQKKN